MNNIEINRIWDEGLLEGAKSATLTLPNDLYKFLTPYWNETIHKMMQLSDKHDCSTCGWEGLSAESQITSCENSSFNYEQFYSIIQGALEKVSDRIMNEYKDK